MALTGRAHCCRGAHTHFLRMGKVERWGGAQLNLLHYDDAAALCMSVRCPRCRLQGICCLLCALAPEGSPGGRCRRD